jgi:uncharacterized membrane protein YdjX (TVP38/TMEM64 family)
VSRRARIVAAIGAWAMLIASWVVYQRRTGVGTVGTAQQLVDTTKGSWWAIVAYVVVSVVRPLVLFPATLVTVAAGMLFGPVVGVVVAAAAANLSAMVGYGVGRTLGRSRASTDDNALSGWAARLRGNSFEAVLLMRLLFLPYDLVNYGCGLLKIRTKPFLAATAIGSLPGTIAFVLAGASITRFDQGIRGLDRRTLVASVLLIVGSIALSRVLRRVNYRAEGDETKEFT